MNINKDDTFLNTPEQSTPQQPEQSIPAASEPVIPSAPTPQAAPATAPEQSASAAEQAEKPAEPVSPTYSPYSPRPQAPMQGGAYQGGAQSAGTTPPAAPTSSVTWNSGAPHTASVPHYAATPNPPQPTPQKKKGNGGKIALVLIAVFVIALGAGFLGASLVKTTSGSTGDAVIYQSDTKTSSDTDSTGSKTTDNTVESVASACAASVVEVKTSYVQKGTFFGDYVTSGAGSGVIISKDGYIVTNNHVIADAEEISVTLKSGKEYKAKLVGTDDKTDIAVLKIEAQDLTPATFGDSSAVAVGEQIVVIGNPLGSLGGSVTTGIISAKDREIEVENMSMTLLQIDAAVNPGNSGGALFNLKGELVGVVNAKYSSEEIEGLGFAIPVNTAKSTVEDIIEYGYVKGRAQLGITAVEISDLQTAFSAGVTELGVYVYSVNDGSGADKAGLKAGDRIVKIDNKEISSYATLSKVLDGHSVGDTVSVTYSRNGEQKTVDVKLIEYKPSTDNKTAN